MRKEEFRIVDEVRKQDMEYLLGRFEKLLGNEELPEEMAMGICLCAGITRAYMDEIGEESKGDNNEHG